MSLTTSAQISMLQGDVLNLYCFANAAMVISNSTDVNKRNIITIYEL